MTIIIYICLCFHDNACRIQGRVDWIIANGLLTTVEWVVCACALACARSLSRARLRACVCACARMWECVYMRACVHACV